jgi:hypothetical protein
MDLAVSVSHVNGYKKPHKDSTEAEVFTLPTAALTHINN